MEDENGLELSLGLSCGGSSLKSKGKIASSSGIRTEESDGGNKIVDDFRNFLQGGNHKQDSGAGLLKGDSVKLKENFFSDLSKSGGDGDDSSTNLKGKGVWVSNNNQSAEFEQEKQPDQVGHKRKSFFEEINHQKKYESEPHRNDLHDKTRTSDLAISKIGSASENEDVAESEVEGSISRHIGVGALSEVPKEVGGFADSSAAEINGQKRYNNLSSSEFKLGNLTYGVPFSVQTANPSTTGQLPGMMQVLPNANGDRSGNMPLLFGSSSVQDNSWGLVSHPPQLHQQGIGPPSSVAMQGILPSSSEVTHYDGRKFERGRGAIKQHITEEGSSSQAGDVKESSTNVAAKDASSEQLTASLSLDFSTIKPGVAADLKFGGSGSFPNLPWVSTTGSGPNGRMISGVTYRYNTNQIRIVCACHGSHMSPEDFVRHAGEEQVDQEGDNGVASFPNSNPASSAPASS